MTEMATQVHIPKNPNIQNHVLNNSLFTITILRFATVFPFFFSFFYSRGRLRRKVKDEKKDIEKKEEGERYSVFVAAITLPISR